METIYVIETDPIKKKYFSDIHCGWICEVHTIDNATQYKSRDKAQQQFNSIVTGDYDSSATLYLSIIKLTIKNK